MSSNTKTQQHFSQIPDAEIQRSTFDRSHGVKTTINSGYLYPILIDEALPGDTFKLRDHIFGRLATPIVPFMDNLYLDTHYFFVPSRLVWDNWERFNGAQTDPDDSTDYIIPTIKIADAGGATTGSIFDHFGIPTKIQNVEFSALPLRCYNLIWNEWYRDQNLSPSLPVHKGDGPDPHTDYVIADRARKKDYFTSALPWPQKGPAVNLPLGTTAPVTGLYAYGTSTLAGPAWDTTGTNSAGGWAVTSLSAKTDSSGAVSAVNHPQVYADLSDATAATINSLRLAFQVQRMYERDARGGTRYIEILKAHFNVTSPDFRLQRPEYLGGNTKNITSTVVPQTSSTDATSPQGNLSAYSQVSDSGTGFTHSFTEHGYVIGLASVRADLNYQQGLNRLWSRKTRFDFYWPALSHLGEQAILNKEIYYQNDEAANNAVFGYQERYAEYRYKPNEIHGQFRSNATGGSLDMWHLADNYLSLPLLNDSFITNPPPVERILAVEDEPQLLLDVHFEYNCTRPMPVYSVPGLVDHF